MAGFLNTDLPSSDEEDDDYKPEQDKTAEAEDRADFIAKAKRPREEDAEEEDHLAVLADDVHNPRTQVKKAKISHLWELLNSRPSAKSAPSTPLPGAATPAEQTAASHQPPATVGPSSTVNLASLCRTVDAKQRKTMNTDMLWMRNLGLAPKQQLQPSTPASQAAAAVQTPAPATGDATPGPAGTATQGSLQGHIEQQQATLQGQPEAAASAADAQNGSQQQSQLDDQSSQQTSSKTTGSQVSESARAMAAAALAAARESGGLGAVRNANKVTITQTRRFAGKDIQVAVQVDKNSKEAAKAAQQAAKPPPSSGLDAFLAEVSKKKKVNVLDKTKADWQQLKAADTQLEEELEAHKRSGAQYLDKVDFLKRSELREYEAERDKRLAADVRTRGRL